MTEARTAREGYSVAALIDVDDFVAGTRTHGEQWGVQAIARTEALIHDSLAGHRVRAVRHNPPDEWLVDLVGSGEDELVGQALDLARSIQIGTRRCDGAPVTVTVTVSSVHDGANSSALAEVEARRLSKQKLIAGGDRVIRGAPATSRPRPPAPARRVSEQLAWLVENNDPNGVRQLLVDWFAMCAADSAATPEAAREWIVGELLFVLSKLAPGRRRDGSVDWLATESSFAVSRILELAEIHERSYLHIWLDQTLAEAFRGRGEPVRVNPLLVRAERYVEAHLSDPSLGLDAVARAVAMSPFYLAHLFRGERDTTFRRHLTARRMELAARLLEEPGLSIERVASRAGYLNVSRFRAAFRRQYGVTPSAFRTDNCSIGDGAVRHG